MPRDGTGVYTYPAGTPGAPDTTIESAKYNAYIADMQNDANNARPIIAGGTGASTAADARANLGAMPSTGGTMAGNITIAPPAGSATLTLIKPASGTHAFIQSYTGANLRWQMYLGDLTAETGANAGSDFYLQRYSDAGGLLGSSLVINRATGAIGINGAPVITGNVAINGTTALNGATTVTGGLASLGDITVYRPGTPTTGYVFYGNTGLKYIGFDGTNFVVNGTAGFANISGNVSASTSLHAGTSLHVATSAAIGTTLNVSGTAEFGGKTYHYGGADIHSSLPTINNAATAPFTIRGGYPALSFYWSGVFHSNITMNTDGNFYMGGGSHGANYYKFWTTRDFTGFPTSYVTSNRLVHVADLFHSLASGMAENWPGSVVTGATGLFSNGITLRYRYLQYLIDGGWYTAGTA